MAKVSALPLPPDDDDPPEATRRIVDQRERVFYCGYWVKTYPVPPDSLAAKRFLIEALARRLFNHTEHGLNMPGSRLAEARAAYANEADPALKRVKGGMLAGALFNRAVDIFRRLVELQSDGVAIESDYSLVRECGECLKEAIALGRLVFHRSGDEGIDELWGEPFRVFSLPLEDYFESRYIKIAQALREVDRIAAVMAATFATTPLFRGIEPLVFDFARIAKIKCETLRTDPDIFDVWAEFVTASERLAALSPALGPGADECTRQLAADGLHLILQGRNLVTDIIRARVTMPKSAREFIERCETFAARAQAASHPPLAAADLGATRA